MRQRNVGSTEQSVSAIGLGCMALSSAYRPTGDAEASALIERALDLGVTHLDSADTYGWGHNERLLGRVLADRRDQVYLASKFGQLVADGVRAVRGDPEYVRTSCEASLERLGIDHIDLYYLHRVDPKVPIEETIGAMAELVEAGKVRHIGISEAAPSTIRRAHATHPLATVQSEYSLWTRFVEDEVLAVCSELGIGFVPYSPIGRGFLSGVIKSTGDLHEEDRRRGLPRFEQENIELNASLLEVLTDVAVEQGASTTQIALAWVLAQGEFILPIPGTTSISHLEENVAAAEIELSDGVLDRLSTAFDPGRVAGARYPRAALDKVDL